MIAKSLALVSALLFLGLAPLGSAPATAAHEEIRVDTVPRAANSRPTVAVFPDGGFVVVWTVSPARGAFTAIHARFFQADGSAATDEFRLIAPAAGSQVANHVAADPDGSFLLAWTEIYPGEFLGNVFVRRFERDGTPRGNRIQLNRPGVEGRDAVLTIGPRRRFAATWQSFVAAGEPSSLSTMARSFTADGTPLSGDIRIGGGTEFLYSSPGGVALGTDGSLTLLLHNQNAVGLTGVWIARVPAGATSPALRRIADYSSGSGTALARLQNGSLVAVWYGFELLARRLGPGGAPRGGAFTASAAFQAVLPKIAPLANGGFVIVWSENFRDEEQSSGYGFFGRAFAANGTPLTSDFLINVTTPGHQYGTGVAAWPGGPVVAVWQAQDEGRVFARVLPIANP